MKLVLVVAIATLATLHAASAQGAVPVILEDPGTPPPAAVQPPLVAAKPTSRAVVTAGAPLQPLPVPQPPVVAAVAPTPAAAAQPSIFGATAWVGTSGAMQVGLAVPLAAWRSIFKLGQGELVVLIGKDEAGLGLGHKFRDVHLDLGGVSAGAAIGVAGLLPYGSTCAEGRTCHTGLRATRAAVFVTLPLSPRQAQ